MNSTDAEDVGAASNSEESLDSLSVQDSLRSISNQRGPPVPRGNLESLRRRSGPAFRVLQQPQTAPATPITQPEACRLKIYVWHEHSQKRTSVELEAGATLKDLYTAVASESGQRGILSFNRRFLDNMDASLASLRIGQHDEVLQQLGHRDAMIEVIIKTFNTKYELQRAVAQARPSGGLVGPTKEYLDPIRKSEVIRDFFARKEIVEIPMHRIRAKEDTLREMVKEYLIHFDDNGFEFKDFFYKKLKSFEPMEPVQRDLRGEAGVYATRTENAEFHSSSSSSNTVPPPEKVREQRPAVLFDLGPRVEAVLQNLELLHHKDKFAEEGYEMSNLWAIDVLDLRALGLNESEIERFMSARGRYFEA